VVRICPLEEERLVFAVSLLKLLSRKNEEKGLDLAGPAGGFVII
jgi:hypothetical protein